MFSNSNTKNKLLSSRRLSNSFDDLRRKSIVKKVNKERENSVYIHTHNPTENYLKNSEYIVVPDNELVSIGDKKCNQYDIYNENLFKKNTKLYHSICQKIEGSVLELKSKPSPLPVPNNFERLMLYRQRNQPFNALHQTCAIIYLLQHNYLLVDDLTKVKPEEIKVSDKTVVFEAYQAIGLATELSHIKGEDFTKIQSGFNNLNLKIDSTSCNLNLKVNTAGYPVQTQPIITNQRIRTVSENSISNSDINSAPIRERSKSIISIHPKKDNQHSLTNIYPSLDVDADIIASTSSSVSASAPPVPSIPTPFNQNTSPLSHVVKVEIKPQETSELKCDCPEHHNISDKVSHFNELVEKNK